MNINKQNITEFKGKTITFYSYKGGVGRTMALVNIACLMAKQKKKVLLIDWDLEAPGLHNFFKSAINNEELGLVDFITDIIEFSISEVTNNDDVYVEFLSKNLDKYIQKNIQIENSEYQIDIIKAGKFDDDYIVKLNAIDWIGLYKNAPSFFRIFAQYLESYYDYILIDSRTGLSDTGGICTMLMPQKLVLVFALNNQNINGVLDVAKQSINYRFNSNDIRDLTILPLPSRIDNQNSSELEVWMKKYIKDFEDLFRHIYMLDECMLENYFNIAKIPYKPIHAYGENIPVLNENINNDFFISYHYANFYSLILDEKPIYEILTNEEIEINRKQAISHLQLGMEYFYQNNYESSIVEFEKACELDITNYSAFNILGLSLGNLAKTKEGKESEELYHQSFEKYQKAIELKPDNHEAYNNWGNYLGNFAKTKEGKEAEELYHLSFEKYQKAIELKSDKHEAYNNWGIDLGNLAMTKEGKEAEELYHQSFEKYQKAIELKPDNHEAYNNWGSYLGNFAKTKEGKEAEELYHLSFEKYQKTVELKPDYHQAYNNWGTDLGNLAKIKEGKEAEELYHQSFEKYQKAIELKPDKYEAYNNWGAVLGNFAKTKEGNESEELFHQSFEKYQKAIELKTDNHESYNNWGNSLGNFAKTKEGNESEELYHQSFEKYQKAIELKPDYHEAYYNWGNYLEDFAKTKEGNESEELYHQSFEKYQKAIEIKPDNPLVYNNWGAVLGNLAKTKEGKESEELYHQSFEKYQKAIELKPDNLEAYENWGISLVILAKTKEGKEKEELYHQSFKKYQKAMELGGKCYNLACLYAIKENKKDSLFYLDLSLKKKEISVSFVLKDEDWKKFSGDMDFVNILNKYRE